MTDAIDDLCSRVDLAGLDTQLTDDVRAALTSRDAEIAMLRVDIRIARENALNAVHCIETDDTLHREKDAEIAALRARVAELETALRGARSYTFDGDDNSPCAIGAGDSEDMRAAIDAALKGPP